MCKGIASVIDEIDDVTMALESLNEILFIIANSEIDSSNSRYKFLDLPNLAISKMVIKLKDVSEKMSEIL
ncbi:hypothetical protein [Faecalibacillus intestinalis]